MGIYSIPVCSTFATGLGERKKLIVFCLPFGLFRRQLQGMVSFGEVSICAVAVKSGTMPWIAQFSTTLI